ncbi:Type-1 restriction enzyme EcoKI specificity protein [Microbacterium oxydans]|uniref:restriction endonuclease subunit S n=1 Tax=Microbacterium oxydans TaxID=82380 RepID=UPI001DBE26A0|nr:restriction endonuclease subunit S [Microbacterium oxydans]CAH0255537.1 Type-1 restriction enzyme EcoKI specificity protein [Microbacterium oxydans]
MTQAALSDIVKIVMGQAPPGTACNKSGEGVPFVKAGEFGDRRPHIREWTTKPLRMAEQDDTLVCVVGATAGKVNQGANCAIGRSVAAVRPDVARINADYLYRFLATNVGRLRGGSQGAAQGVITRDMIGRLKLELPPLAEQRRIAAILDHADAIRAKRRHILADLDELIQATFLDMFGDVRTMRSLSSLVAEFRYGTSNKSGASGLPTLRIPNVIGGGIDHEEIKTVTVTESERDRLALSDGDLLFVRTNGNPDNVGRCAVFTESAVASAGFGGASWIFASYLIRARLNDPAAAPFVSTYLATHEGRKHLRDRAKTSAGQYNVNTESIGSLPIPDVDDERHVEFASRLRRLTEQRAKARAALLADDELFASLQSRAFRGEL